MPSNGRALKGLNALGPKSAPPYGPWGALGPERIAVLEWVLSATALRGCACAFAFLFSVFLLGQIKRWFFD